MNRPSSSSMSASARLQDVSGDFGCLVGHLAGRDVGRRSAHHRRARAHGADAEHHLVRIAVHHLDVRGLDPEPAGDDLLVHGLVPLALGLGAHEKPARSPTD